MWFHLLSNMALRIALRILLKLDIRGQANMPTTGAVIVAINHTSFFDPLIAISFLPRNVFPMAKVELFETPFFGWVFPAYGAIPIRRGEADRSAIRQSLNILRNGGVLLVAPEGTRSSDGRLQRGRNGAALLAVRTDAMVLPIAIWGVRSFWETVWHNIRRRKRVEVHMVISEPLRIAVEGRKIPREQLDEITDELMYRLAELLPPEYRGVYENLDQATDYHLSPANM